MLALLITTVASPACRAAAAMVSPSRRSRAIGDDPRVGIAGTFITAAVLTGAAHWLLGMDWKLAGVVGAALAPTDPAVVFSVLGGREIGGRSGTTLEGEAGVNDPAGIALMNLCGFPLSLGRPYPDGERRRSGKAVHVGPTHGDGHARRVGPWLFDRRNAVLHAACPAPRAP